MQSPGELLAAVVQKYFSVASAQWAVALLGNAEFGDLWSWLEVSCRRWRGLAFWCQSSAGSQSQALWQTGLLL